VTGAVVRDGPTPEQRHQLEAIGAASGLGCSIVATLLLFIGGGVLLDRQFGTSPLLTLIGLVVALVACGYQLYELTLVGRRDREAGPLGRRFATLRGRRSATARPPDGEE